MDKHKHNFTESEWPFKDPVDLRVFTTKKVVYDEHPILVITHEDDGDWQFLCGTTDESDDIVLSCFGCMLENHPFIKEFADLPKGCWAWRNSVEEPWVVEEMDSEEND